MFARANSLFHSQSHQQRFREQRKLRGHASTALEVSKFVAYVPDYTNDTSPEDRHDFWVGKIIELSPDTDQLRVTRWHTGPVNNLENPRAVYRVWQGEGPKTEWLDNCRVLEQFQLTAQGKLIGSRVRGFIGNAIAMHEACRSGAPSDIAVGTYLLENPRRPGVGHNSEDEDEDNDQEQDEDDDNEQELDE